MKKILSKIVALASLFVLVGFVTVSCDKKKDEPQQKKTYKELIVGSWKFIAQETTHNGVPKEPDKENIGRILSFNADGTGDGEGRKFNYKIENAKIILINPNEPEEKEEADILELNDKTLKVKTIFVDGPVTDISIATYERVK